MLCFHAAGKAGLVQC